MYSGIVSHLPGAPVLIQEAGRHFGKTGTVVGRAVQDKVHAAYVRVPSVSRKGKLGTVVVVLPDAQLERTPESLIHKIRSTARTLFGTLAGPQAPVSLFSSASRKPLTAQEYKTRTNRRHMAEASRQRNRK